MSIVCYSFIKLSNVFVFPDREPPIIKILYEWSGIYGHFSLCFLLFSFVTLSKLTILYCITMAALKKVKSHLYVVDYFKELPFYNKHIEKPSIKRLKNIDLLPELPFYLEVNLIKTNYAFRWYTMSYKAEIIEKKDPIK